MMNDFAETRAFAKVNLTLDVLKKRADGYHELSTVMQTIDLYDELYADFSHEDIAVTADFDLPRHLPTQPTDMISMSLCERTTAIRSKSASM